MEKYYISAENKDGLENMCAWGNIYSAGILCFMPANSLL